MKKKNKSAAWLQCLYAFSLFLYVSSMLLPSCKVKIDAGEDWGTGTFLWEGYEHIFWRLFLSVGNFLGSGPVEQPWLVFIYLCAAFGTGVSPLLVGGSAFFWRRQSQPTVPLAFRLCLSASAACAVAEAIIEWFILADGGHVLYGYYIFLAGLILCTVCVWLKPLRNNRKGKETDPTIPSMQPLASPPKT